MALALRLRRAIAAASLLRPAASASTATRSAPLAPSAALPVSRPWLPAGAGAGAAGFRSSAAAAARGEDYGRRDMDDKISPDEILFEGCDYNHWLITMEFPDPKPTREEMIETYLQTLAKVVGSYEEAKKRMYAFSTTTYVGFQAVMTEEMSEKFRGLPGVVFILPDSYLYPETKEYGGDKYENGVITPRPPPVHYSKPSRTDRNRNYRGNYQNSPPQGNYQNSPPQGNYQNSPPQGNYQNSPPQGNYQNGPRPYGAQQDGRGYAPQQNYAQAGQGGQGYVRNNYTDRPGYSGSSGGYQGHANPPGQGQGYYNSQEHRNFSQEQAGNFRPGGSSAPGTYGQPPAPGSYVQSPQPTYSGSNQGTPGVNPGYGGNNRQGAGPAYGGDNWQGGSNQYPSQSEGQQESWQGRQ
ncbi:multiple organellar RNA editing factor 1, mitochondrial [Oryza brachyantha]|uniref:multiple organellar RNA editing factor 1, mitochondrial n=1 Tax=Oryza brachyantha TaxID=4533 RepID=UPI001ADBFBCA|nr:multiple organellar RNA editing factor 1, mitochondrial [Oryza brachyantha]